MISKSLSFFSWNVRGLGQSSRCEDVLSELITNCPTFVAIQESKLTDPSNTKLKSFLPTRLLNSAFANARGASGGILTAWDDRTCSLASSSERAYSLTTCFNLCANGDPLTLTNVYAPTKHDEKQAFFSEMLDVASSISGPWIILGDFNLVCDPSEKNSTSFDGQEAQCFNDLIHNLALIEIPLVDRAYTWNNKRDIPTLVRLDRCFINLAWDDSYPNTTMSSLTRFASDHVPLFVSAVSHVPRGSCFHFENSWLRAPSFKPLIFSVLANQTAALAGKMFVQLLKRCRFACKSWAREHRSLNVSEKDTKVLIDALDLLEEQRPLNSDEALLRTAATQELQNIHAERLSYWRQRFNLRVALEWDENSKFFHAAASGRRRKNTIQ
ncbi:hypothetical protein PVAP13_3NG329201 [Panicum virgatum]|uniref:Endonuclease/exonuclease/phosphatase domain-containing protein n=1 Tax=Panicum virgatum TaxID=38727 RepID=A0A8T0UIJ0_PANVG|nr:hypothetical protein PVAP13_3NG329201 [Panicum virgatum]